MSQTWTVTTLVMTCVTAVAGCDLSGAECERDGDCRGADVCDDGACVECASDSDCDDGEQCERNECREPAAPAPATLVEAVCAHRDACGFAPPETGTCIGNLEALIETSAEQNTSLCDELNVAIDDVLRCELASTCASLEAGSACPDELDELNEMFEEEDLTLCLTGEQPEPQPEPSSTAPLAWLCPVEFFGTDDGCDCGCGARDPDCGIDGGCSSPGCGAELCEFCYPDEASAEAGAGDVCGE